MPQKRETRGVSKRQRSGLQKGQKVKRRRMKNVAAGTAASVYPGQMMIVKRKVY